MAKLRPANESSRIWSKVLICSTAAWGWTARNTDERRKPSRVARPRCEPAGAWSRREYCQNETYISGDACRVRSSVRPLATTPTIALGAWSGPRSQTFAESGGGGKVPTGEGLVDDGDRRRVVDLSGAEVAALDDRQAEQLEIARSDGAQRKARSPHSRSRGPVGLRR